MRKREVMLVNAGFRIAYGIGGLLSPQAMARLRLAADTSNFGPMPGSSFEASARIRSAWGNRPRQPALATTRAAGRAGGRRDRCRRHGLRRDRGRKTAKAGGRPGGGLHILGGGGCDGFSGAAPAGITVGRAASKRPREPDRAWRTYTADGKRQDSGNEPAPATPRRSATSTSAMPARSSPTASGAPPTCRPPRTRRRRSSSKPGVSAGACPEHRQRRAAPAGDRQQRGPPPVAQPATLPRRPRAGAKRRLRPPDDLEAEAIARVDAIQQLREGGEAIRALPRREREVLALLAWSDLSYGEIAEALGLPVGTVRSRLARARARLGDAFPDPTAATRPAEEPL